MGRKSGWLGGGALSLLLFGTGSSLFGKVIYELQGPDRSGHPKYFAKPWASTCAMFIGMMFCLPGLQLMNLVRRQLAKRRRSGEESEALLGSAASDTSATSEGSDEDVAEPPAAAPAVDKPPLTGAAKAKKYALILIPTAFDLIATVLMSVGLLFITVSVYQMMRGAEVVFTAVFSVTFLGRELNRHHIGGICVCTAGIVLVGMASVASGEGGTSKPVSSQQMIIGMLLVVAAEAVQAAQVVVEDHFMSNMDFKPIELVGYEGLFGFALMAGLLLPILQWMPGTEGSGLHEDTIETLHMLAGSRPLQVAMLVFVATMAFYNVAGMMVTEEMGAVTRTVLETLRTLLVWLLDLLIYYAAPLGQGAKLGEPWTSASWLQAVGFAVLVGGTLVYGMGDDIQEKQLKHFARMRARERWARIRVALPELTAAALAARKLTPEERHPMAHPRIAGPARIRTALLPVLFIHRLQGLARPRWGSLASSSANLEHLAGAAGAAARHGRDDALLHALDVPWQRSLSPARQGQGQGQAGGRLGMADVVEQVIAREAAARAAAQEAGSGGAGGAADPAPGP